MNSNNEQNITLNASHLQRLWQRDVSLWEHAKSDESVTDRLGWLDAVNWMEQHVPQIQNWTDELVQSGRFDTLLLLGMGGSSLAAEVYYSVFGNREGYLTLTMLDSTSPAQIMDTKINPDRTLVLVSSKSGGTVETADLMAWFHDQFGNFVDHPGDHFVAITDPGSALAQQAQQLGFRDTFLNPPDIGGRYSALSYFGLVPAALTGVRLSTLLDHTRDYVSLLQDSSDENGEIDRVVQLANLLSDVGANGLNILVLQLAPEIEELSVWIEQLVAESTGKNGIGVIPLPVDLATNSQHVADDEVRVTVQLGKGEPDGQQGANSIQQDSRNLDLRMSCRHDLGKEFLRWEIATALAASRLGINPFDQPDVEGAKVLTRSMVAGKQSISILPAMETEKFRIEFPAGSEQAAALFAESRSLSLAMPAWAGDARYLAILAWLPMQDEIIARLEKLADNIAWLLQVRTTTGFGPRYLHSTGQLHKGGPEVGCFLQIVEDDMPAMPVPGRDYGFDTLHHAQADGDFTVLAEKRLPVMRIRLKGDRLKALDILAEELG